MGLKYYKKNVRYSVGVRKNINDTRGKLLTNEDPYYAVADEDLRDFKLANKYGIMEGLIKEAAEPSTDWEVPNAIDQDEMGELLKSYLILKKTLPTITSIPIAEHLLELAREQARPVKTLSLIQARLDELKPDDDIALSDMRGVE